MNTEEKPKNKSNNRLLLGILVGVFSLLIVIAIIIIAYVLVKKKVTRNISLKRRKSGKTFSEKAKISSNIKVKKNTETLKNKPNENDNDPKIDQNHAQTNNDIEKVIKSHMINIGRCSQVELFNSSIDVLKVKENLTFQTLAKNNKFFNNNNLTILDENIHKITKCKQDDSIQIDNSLIFLKENNNL
jgi:hypothetical protein